MARMPRFEEEIRRDWTAFDQSAVNAFDAFRPHHHTSAETPAAAPTIGTNPTPEDPVSVLTDIETSVNDVLARLKDVDTDALDKIDAIKANPEASVVLDALATVAKAELPAGWIDVATSGLQRLAELATQPTAAGQTAVDAATPPAPGGPVIAGQA